MMCSLAERSLSLLALLIASTASNAFLTPVSTVKVGSMPRTALRQSSVDDDGSNTVNIAYITKTDGNSEVNEELQTKLKDHPFCKMAGIKLSIAGVPVTSTETDLWTKEHVTHLQQADIACFETVSAVKSYLDNLDHGHFDIAKDMSDEDRRKLPNKPDLVGGILGIEGGEDDKGATTSTATLMAACPNASTGRECLNSGRWMSNHIYYPKDTQPPVELKTEPIEGAEEDVAEEEDEEFDVELWVDSIVQAAGDVMERKFWGGGW